MKRCTLFLVLFSAVTVVIYPQLPDDKVVMTVGNIEVTAGELMRMYNKSTNPADKMPLDEYIDLFTLFKLKVAQAVDLGMDTTKVFRQELKGYRDQLAKNYLTDTTARRKIYMKAYSRMQKEINASHILILCPPDAQPSDTIRLWNRADSIMKAARSGSDFRTLAVKLSQDPSAKINGGNLGYFTAFQMIAPFENAVFQASQGEIIGPVRTPYGYHIIKLNATRPASGRVRIAHIFRMIPQGAGEQEALKIKSKADSIYALLKSGADFAQIAAKYSEHRETAGRGGELNWFGTGEIISEIAEPSFSLKDTGAITEPVRSPFGWHIIKLLEKKPPPSFAEAYGFIESRVNEDLIETTANNNFISQLKIQYNYRENKREFKSLLEKCDSSVISGVKQLTNTREGNYIISFNDIRLTVNNFISFINNNREKSQIKSPEEFLRNKLDRYAAKALYDYENSNLEKKYSDFRYLVKEFHDGILMFELSSQKVWDKAKADTAGLRQYWLTEWKGDRTIPFDNVKEELIQGYQDYLEKNWILQLKKDYIVKTDRKSIEMLRKESE